MGNDLLDDFPSSLRTDGVIMNQCVALDPYFRAMWLFGVARAAG